MTPSEIIPIAMLLSFAVVFPAAVKLGLSIDLGNLEQDADLRKR